MTRLVLVAAGGTIASTVDDQGAASAALSGAEVLARLVPEAAGAVQVVEAMNVNSYAMGLAEIDHVRAIVERVLEDADVAGVVVTHGTDTLEETALALHLALDDDRPVVLTGAQRDSDDPDSDGVANLRDAIAVAGDPGAAGRGVLVCFAGRILPAVGVRKVQTLDPRAFAAVSGRGHGGVHDGRVTWAAPPGARPARLRAPLGSTRVDIVSAYPGADRVALDACVAAGAHGIVLEATGAGNATPSILEAVREYAPRIRFVVSTRVPEGPVTAIYRGSGGGVDLLEAGAIGAGWLRPGQARIALAALLAADAGAEQVREWFAELAE